MKAAYFFVVIELPQINSKTQAVVLDIQLCTSFTSRGVQCWNSGILAVDIVSLLASINKTQSINFYLHSAKSHAKTTQNVMKAGPPEQARCSSDQEKTFCGKKLGAGPDPRGRTFAKDQNSLEKIFAIGVRRSLEVRALCGILAASILGPCSGVKSSLVGVFAGFGGPLFVAASVFSRLAFFLTTQVTETEVAALKRESGDGGKQ